MLDLGASAPFSAINTTFMFANFVIALSDVGPENQVFVRIIQRVRCDLEEAERLMRSEPIKLALSNVPAQVEYINEKILATKRALNEIGLYVERVRSDSERDGEISFANRVRWVLKDHAKLGNRQTELAACHQALGAELANLHRLEITANSIPDPSSMSGFSMAPPLYSAADGDAFMSPSQKKRRTSTLTSTRSTSSFGMRDSMSQYDGSRQTPSDPASPVPSSVLSHRSSFSSTNFGPINPWDFPNDHGNDRFSRDDASVTGSTLPPSSWASDAGTTVENISTNMPDPRAQSSHSGVTSLTRNSFAPSADWLAETNNQRFPDRNISQVQISSHDGYDPNQANLNQANHWENPPHSSQRSQSYPNQTETSTHPYTLSPSWSPRGSTLHFQSTTSLSTFASHDSWGAIPETSNQPSMTPATANNIPRHSQSRRRRAMMEAVLGTND